MAVLLAITQNRLPKRPEMHIPTSSRQGDFLWLLLGRCWAAEPGTRPTAAHVRDNVSALTYQSRSFADWAKRSRQFGPGVWLVPGPSETGGRLPPCSMTKPSRTFYLTRQMLNLIPYDLFRCNLLFIFTMWIHPDFSQSSCTDVNAFNSNNPRS
jgi:hypothetical protein